MTQLKRIHAVVHGRVQGVFFRDYTRRRAGDLGLHGWVRNLPDRTVETVFEGRADKVDALLSWLHDGSPQSRVSEVEAVEEEPVGDDAGFYVRY